MTFCLLPRKLIHPFLSIFIRERDWCFANSYCIFLGNGAQLYQLHFISMELDNDICCDVSRSSLCDGDNGGILFLGRPMALPSALLSQVKEAEGVLCVLGSQFRGTCCTVFSSEKGIMLVPYIPPFDGVYCK